VDETGEFAGHAGGAARASTGGERVGGGHCGGSAGVSFANRSAAMPSARAKPGTNRSRHRWPAGRFGPGRSLPNPFRTTTRSSHATPTLACTNCDGAPWEGFSP
jgi:hypothetical protein